MKIVSAKFDIQNSHKIVIPPILKNENRLERVGSARKGQWKVLE